MGLGSTSSAVVRRLSRVVLALVPAVCTVGSLQAEEDYDNWKRMDVPPAPALSPAEQEKTFRIAPGFEIELVAAEPQIVDPVAIRWDAAGRLWAVEMRGYMPNVQGEGEDEPVGRIAVLEDADSDGYMEKRTTFLDELVMPRALALVEGGVLVAEPPHLWYCRDTDGDLKSDEKTDLLNYAKQGPVEHTENGLRRTINNWIYNAKSDRRFRFSLKDGEPTLTVEPTAFRGQWGIAQDSFGRLYFNNNSHYLTGETFPHELKTRRYRLSDESRQSRGIASDHSVHSIRVNPGINRGYIDGMLREDGRLKRPTAVSGQVIYRGDQLPGSFREDAFVPEPAGNVLTYFDIKRDGDSVEAEHRTFDDPDWGQREFLASTDERFRPVDVENGPDGTLYVVDLYRGILQHKNYVTAKYLKKQILARGLDKPVGLGRIWCISSTEDGRRTDIPDLRQKSSAELVELLGHPNGWHRDWAQRLLIQREGRGVVDDLRQLAASAERRIARVHAIWTLEGVGELDERTIRTALNAPDLQVRIAAARARVPAEQPPIDFSQLEEGRVEAEAAQKIRGAIIETTHQGYTGEGYVDFQTADRDRVQWRLAGVPAGTYRLEFRYAMGGDARPVKAVVNDTVVEKSLALPDSGGWKQWATRTIEVTLKEGENTLRLEAIGDSGPNIDHIRLLGED